MNGRVFSGVVRLPPVHKGAVALGVLCGLFPFAVVFVFLIWSVQAPPAYRPGAWSWPVCFGAAAGFILVMAGLILAMRRLIKRRLAAALTAWSQEPQRTAPDLAAAAFYHRLIGARRAKRAIAVSAFLAAVPANACRTVVIGDFDVTPVDDGTLNEECDAFEGRSRASLRWLVVLLMLPFVAQLGLAVSMNGFDFRAWTGMKLLVVLPAVFNLLLIVFVHGLVRPIGTVVLASPRRLAHSTVRGLQVFTPDDSVMLVTGAQRQHIVVFYRNDGRTAYVRYGSLKTLGYQQLVNRWCMTTDEA